MTGTAPLTYLAVFAAGAAPLAYGLWRTRLQLNLERKRSHLMQEKQRGIRARLSELQALARGGLHGVAVIERDDTLSPLTEAFKAFQPATSSPRMSWQELLRPEFILHFECLLHSVRQGDTEREAFECRLATADGPWVRLTVRSDQGLRPEGGAEGGTRALLTIEDLSSLKELELFKLMGTSVLEAIQEPVVATFGDDDRIAWVNAAFERFSGWPRADLEGKSLSGVLKSTPVHEPMPSTLELVANEGLWSGEFRSVTAAGDLRLERRAVMLFEDEARQGTQHLIVFKDLTDEMSAQEHLEVLMQVDVATELPNLYGFLAALRQRLLACQGPNRLSVVVLDFHGCASLRTSSGSGAQDAAMRHIAELLSARLDDHHMLSRVAAAQLALVIPSTNVVTIDGTLQALTEVLKTESELQGSDIFSAVSIGVAPGGEGVVAEHLLHAAQVTSARLTSSSGVNLGYFSEQLQVEVVRRQRVELALREALRERPSELLLHFQPKINPHKNALVGFEALCRWRSRTLQEVSPAEFIPAAESSGLIVQLGDLTFEMACKALAAWRDQRLTLKPVAVNVSAHQLMRETLAGEFLAIAERFDIPPKLLEIEVTESVVMRDIEHAAEQLMRLRKAGFAIALDDFGTGQSSLAYLRKLPLDSLKIDCSFIADIETRPDAASICRTILEMGRSLRLKVVAEGVETEGQLEFLVAHNCDVIQGYLFSRPVPQEAVSEMLSEQARVVAHMFA